MSLVKWYEILFLVGYMMSNGDHYREIPPCPEDVVLVGSGEFDDGYWTEWVCGPALDDFGGEW